MKSSYFFLFLITCWLSVGKGEDCNCSQAQFNQKDSVVELKKLADLMPQFVGSNKIEHVADFCRVNGYRDSKEQETRQEDPWVLNFIAAQDSREQVFRKVIDSKKIRSLIVGSSAMSKAKIKSCQNNIAQMKASESYLDSWAKNASASLASGFFCKDLTIARISKCVSAMNKGLNKLTPVHDIANVNLWNEIMSDPIYFRASKEVALSILDKIDKKNGSKTRLFDDIKASFLKVTKDNTKATDYTFKLLGALATGGSNAGNIIPFLCADKGDSLKGVSSILKVIAMGSLVLDRANAKNGFLYSYPSEVNSLCDYGKNYHFWMTAYLAYEAAKQNGDSFTSAVAAFSLDKAYQFSKDGNGRDPSRPFKENAFTNYNNNIRLDLTQAAAGSWFGATYATGENKPLSKQQFDDGLRQMFEGSKTIQIDSDFSFPSRDDKLKMLSVYSKWKDVINPDAAFKYYENILRK